MNGHEAPDASVLEDALSKLIEYNDKVREGNYEVAGCSYEARGGVIIVDQCHNKPIIIIGDIHGDIESLIYIDEIVLKDKAKSSMVIFLGDYVDRASGVRQIKTVIKLSEIAGKYAGNVLLLRGNHEPPRGLEPMPHDYPEALISLYGDEAGYKLYEDSRRFFDSLFHAVVVKEGVLAVHGGPPTWGFDRDVFEYLDWRRETERFIEILWNDPYEGEYEQLPNPRGVGKLWGKPVTVKALEATNTKIIVRAHEPVASGYKFNHERRVITVFSRKGAPYGNPLAAVIICQSSIQLARTPRQCVFQF